MKNLFRLLAVVIVILPVLAQAQSGIGTFSPDADKALHVVARPGQQPIRLQGLNDDATDLLEDVVVTDANGVLYYRPIADLTISGEWIDHPTLPYIFANQADAAGNDVVVSDDGRFGIGTVAPRSAIDIVNGGLVIERPGTNVSGTPNNNEGLRLAGNAGDVLFATSSNNFDFNLKFNADINDQYLNTNETAVKIAFDGDSRTEALNGQDGDAFNILTTQNTGAVGAGISWDRPFTIENSGEIGLGTTNPQRRLHIARLVNGESSVRLDLNGVPTGVINNVPATDPEVMLIDAVGDIQRIQPHLLFDQQSEWVDATSGNYVYARRARDEGATNYVVIDDDGNMGLGLTNPDELLELSNGGMVVNGYGFGIGFNGATPYPADPLRDGARMYQDQNALGGNRDALIIEKTDFNNIGVDGGIIFANRAAGNTRDDNVIIDRFGRLGVQTMRPRQNFHSIGTALIQENDGGQNAVGGLLRIGDDQGSLPWATRGVQVHDEGDYVYFGLRREANNLMDAVAMWGSNNNEDFRFIQVGGTTEREVMTLAGDNRYVGIGVPDPQRHLHVGGRLRVDDLYTQNGEVNGSAPDDRIVTVDVNGDVASIEAADLFQDFEDDDWVINGNNIYNANTGNVGVGLIAPAAKFHLDGNMRLEDQSPIEFDNANARILSPNSGYLDIEAEDLTTFQHRSGGGTDPLVVNHRNGRVGVGLSDPNVTFEVDGLARMRDQTELQFGSNTNNMIYAQSTNDFRQTANQLWSVRNRGDATGVLSVRADQRRVGINRNNPEDAFDVDGRMRLRDVPVANGYDQFLVVNPADGTVRRRELDNFEGPWERTVSGAEGRTVLRDVNDVVGIGTATPSTNIKLHIVEQNGTVAQASRGTIMLDHEDNGGSSSIVFRSRQNRNSDYAYINYYDDNPDLTTGTAEQSLLEIGVENDGANNNRDDIALMPSGELGIKTREPSRVVDINGDLRVRTIADSPSDIYALTTDVDGNVNRQDISAIRDNLGNHIATQNIELADNVISYAGLNNTGMAMTSDNHVMFSNRLQLGNHSTNWISDPIPGATEGFVGNDAAFFVPVRTGSENADLRLYIQDNNNDQFSVWGNPCATADCGSVAGSTPVIKFFAGGDVDVTRLAHGGGTPLLVTADASGTLILGPDPASFSPSGSTADNLGNHTATTNIRIGNNAVTRTGAGAEGFRINTDGNIVYNDGRALLWGSTYGTAISGDVDANGDGTARDLRLEADDDFYVITTGGSADVIFDSQGDIEMEADNYFRFYSGTDNNNDDFRFFTDNSTERFRIANDGVVRIQDLGGGGDRLVGVDNNGDLYPVSTSSDGLWDRDAGNAETFLFNNGDDVGIGTADPDAALHVFRNSNSVEAEIRLQNNNNNGDSRIRFMDQNNPVTRGMSFRYDGGDNQLYLEHNDGRQYMTFEQGNGNIGVGAPNPQVMLHVMRRAGSVATGGSDAQSGYNNPARMRISNEAGNGSSALEFSEGQAGLGNNNGMSLRYQGDLDEFHVVRGPSEDQNLNDIHLRIARNSGQTTIRHLGTTVTPGGTEMVIADQDGVLSTRAFDDTIWGKDDTDSEVWLDPAISGYQVGIGTANPQRKLHVAGDVRIDNFGTGGITDDVVTVDANGDLRTRPAADFENFWRRDAADQETYTAFSNDDIGIGEIDPQEKLDVAGSVRIQTIGAGNVATDVIVVADPNGVLRQIPVSTFDDFWSRNTGGASDYIELATGTDLVGIGTSGIPAAKLHVAGDVRIDDLATGGTAEMVVADASGNLSTQAIAEELWIRDASGATDYTFLSNATDFVGVGVGAPTAKFHIGSVAGTDDPLRVEGLRTALGTVDERVMLASADGTVRLAAAGDYTTPWLEDAPNTRVTLNENDFWVGIGTQSPESVLHIEDNVPLASGDMEMRLQNRSGGGNVNLRFRTGTNGGGFNDENNSMILRYTNQYDALEITNGYGAADPSYSSHFKVRRNNGFVGINVGTANPSDQLEVGTGNVRISNGNLEFGQRRRIQWDDANSFIGDNGDLANRDLYISSAEDMIIRGQNRVLVRAQGANGDFDVDASRNAFIDANEGIRINAQGADLDLRAGNNSATDDIIFRAGGGTYGIMYGDGRFYLYGGGSDPDKLDVNGQVRLRDLSAGPNPGMVVADNNGRLSKQAIPTFTDTDDQGLLFSGGVITIEDGTGSIDLAPYFDNTDAQALSFDGSTGIVTLVNGGTIDLSSSAIIDDQDLTLSGSILSLTNDATTVDLSGFANTDAQAIGISGDDLTITGNASTVDLSGYLDNTDAQALSFDGATGIVTLVNGGTVDLSSSAIIDDQDLTLTGSILSLTNDATTVDLSGFANTDDQDLTWTAGTSTLSIEAGNDVNLSSLLDNTDAQAISLLANTLSITGNASTVDLSGYVNTDAQDLELSGNTLSLTNDGTTVDLSGFANTDAQALSYDPTTGIMSLVNGGTVDLSASTIIDDQTLSLSGTELTIVNGNMVDLAPIGALASGWSRSGTDVTLGGGATNVGIGTSPAAGMAFHVSGQARFDALAGGTGLGFVMADINGTLTKRVVSAVTGWNYTGGSNISLATASQNLMVGIGTATAKLHVDGSTFLDGTLDVDGATTFNNDVDIDLSATGTRLTVTGNGTDDPLRLLGVQAAGAGPHNVLVLDAAGNVQVVNGVTASDRRLKENIKPMEGTLEKLLGMESVSFNYRKDVKDYPHALDEETHYGVIAQQVQKAFPHAVVEKDGYLHIQEKELMGVVIAATKELSAQNAELEAANGQLAEQVYHMMMDKAELEKTVHSLEAQTSELQASMAKVLKHLENGSKAQAGGN